MARKGIAATITALKVGQSARFDIEQVSTVRSTASTKGAITGNKYSCSMNTAKRIVTVKREK